MPFNTLVINMERYTIVNGLLGKSFAEDRLMREGFVRKRAKYLPVLLSVEEKRESCR